MSITRSTPKTAPLVINRSGLRLADYALHQQDNPGRLIAFIEAKKLRDDLTDGDRDQVLGYAKERNVQHFILTNGDQWELYEKDKPRPICTLSIRNQQASECARLLLAHFPKSPGFEAARSANRPEVAIPGASDSDALSPTPTIQTHPASESPQKADFAKPIAWFAVCLSSFGLVGWITGVLTAQPNQSILVYVGVFGFVAGIVFASILLVKRFFPSVLPVTIKSLISTLSLASTTSGNTANDPKLGRPGYVLRCRRRRRTGPLHRLMDGATRCGFSGCFGRALTLLLGAIVRA